MFKKSLQIFLFLVLITAIHVGKTYAQDKMILRNGNELTVKVIEVDTDIIKYKKYDNLNGPIYSIDKSKVFMITYKNGTKDVFKKQPSQGYGNNDNQLQNSYNQPYHSNQPVRYDSNFKRKDPGTAFLWSFLIPGAGQIYAGSGPAVTIISYGGLAAGIIAYSISEKNYYDYYGGYTANDPTYVWIGLGIYTIGWIYGMADSGAAARRANSEHGLISVINKIQPTMLNAPNGRNYAGLQFSLNF